MLLICAVILAQLALGAQSAMAASVQTNADQTAGLHMVEDGSGEIIIELQTPEFMFEDGVSADGPCKKIVVPGYEQSSTPGAPQLPMHVGMVGAPPAGNISIEVRSIESVTLNGGLNICPAPLAMVEEGAGDVTRFIEQPAHADPTVYGLDLLYPQQPAAVNELGFMRSQRLARFALYPFQINHVTGQLIYHRTMQVAVRFSNGVVQISGESVVEDAAFERVMQGVLLNYDTARNWRGAPVTAQSVDGWSPPADAYRVLIEQTGIYRLPYEVLQAAGFPVDVVDPEQIRMLHDGQEIAIHISGEIGDTLRPNNTLFFYGEATDERFARHNVYWLSLQPPPNSGTDSASVGLRMEVSINNRASSAVPETIHVAQIFLEENQNYVSSLPREPGYDHWYGRRITAVGLGVPASQDTTLDLGQIAKGGALTARIEVALAGNVKGTHHARILINKTEVFDGSWQDRTYQTLEASFAQTLLTDGQNTVRIQLVNDTPNQTVDMVYVDWIRLTYTSLLEAQANQIDFTNRGPGNWKYAIGGFDAQDVEAYDVTEPTKVRLVPGKMEEGRFLFSDYQATPRRYVISASANLHTPISVTRVNSSDLRVATSSIDYIIIAHPEFINAIRPLADFRARHGLNVQVVNLQDIYDQFNYGRESTQAIHDFLTHAYRSWPAPAPRYVLLVGDGNYDPRGYLDSSERSFLPPYLAMVDPDLGETAADNRYAAIVGNDLIPDLAIGRFPAKTPADVAAMVEKTLRYEQAPEMPTWNQRLLFLADDLDGGGGAFRNFSNAIADGHIETAAGRLPLVPEAYTKTKIYLGQECEDTPLAIQCRQDIVDEMNKGVLLVSYVGHGAKQYWAEEQILNQDALWQLNNEGRLPIMLPMTCLEGFFHEAAANSDALGERIVRMPQSGAVASWSPTGFGLASGHDYLETGFFLALFHQELTTVGEATTYGKLYMLANAPPRKYDDLIDTFVLFGDPALGVRVAGRAPIVDIQHQYLPILMRN